VLAVFYCCLFCWSCSVAENALGHSS